MYPKSLSQTHTPTGKHCVLMFSGGRDSTLAALRLHKEGYKITLITVQSNHLYGITLVHQRLRELRNIIPENTPWLVIQQPSRLRTDTSFYEMTCLPCHHAYVVIAAALSLRLKTSALAFGYAGYQNTWPEQTPLATSRLRAVLRRHNIELHLPVYNLDSRQQVIDELRAFGVTTESLEQKCLQQVHNIALPEDKLTAQIDPWEQAIEESITKLHLIEIAATNVITIRDI